MTHAADIALAGVSVTDLRKAMTQVLKAELPAVLEARAVASGIGLPAPRTWHRLPDMLQLDPDRSPAVFATGATSEFERLSGFYQGEWAMGAFGYVAARDADEVADRVGEYVACLRAALLAVPRLDGTPMEDRTSGITLIGEVYDRGDSDESRTIGGGGVIVSYRIDRAADPAAPPPIEE